MEIYPYWAYAAVPGALDAEREEAALDEGRRLAALTLALQGDGDVGDILAAAVRFEAYLKGEGGADRG